MQDFRYAKVSLFAVIVNLMIFGLSAHSISPRGRRFHTSYIWTAYSITITLLFTMSYGRSVFEDYLTNKFDLKNAAKLHSYMNITASLVNYLTALILSRVFVRFLNSVPLFEIMQFFDVSPKMVMLSIRLVVLKAILIPIMHEVTLILQQIHNDPDKNIAWTLYTLLPMLIAQMFPNLYFGTLVICKMLVTVLNEHLNEIVNEVNWMQSALQIPLHKPYYRMQRFCTLADRLDLLAQKYNIICEKTTKYLQLLSAPLLCSLLCNLCGITAGCFSQYLSIADTLVNNEPYDYFKAITNAIFLAICVIEVLLQGHICDDNRLMVQETGLILQRINLTHADIRFKQSVEHFSLLVLAIDYKIQPLGLLEINISIVQDVLSAVASFLLIFIQSDLTLRFSLM
ncbi:putative gustatory receptor 94a [Anastrepha obliqua]|uniref:putative gustatory receptor 94a n=1 Tax=Anastrepha obliqua TaxID=95512 RepID=UPI0024092712|nr:putative gustatory receptor 94a [Anastrepha obliqua]